jgi:hypothetical protein
MLGGHENPKPRLGSRETAEKEHKPSLDYGYSPHLDQPRYSSSAREFHTRDRLVFEEVQVSQREIIEIDSSGDEYDALGCTEHESEHPSRDSGVGGNDGRNLAFYSTDDVTITGNDKQEDKRLKALAVGSVSRKSKRNKNSSESYRWRKKRNNNGGGQSRATSSEAGSLPSPLTSIAAVTIRRIV